MSDSYCEEHYINAENKELMNEEKEEEEEGRGGEGEGGRG